MPLNDNSALGLGNRFKVNVMPGDYDLGSWAKAEGLDVSWEVPEYRTGDAWNDRWFAPNITKYTPVKLTRAAESKDSQTVKAWLNKNATKHDIAAELKITLCDSMAVPVMDWTLKNIIVKKWSITSMDAGSSSVAIETLEIDHGGFLDDEKKL